MRRRAFLIPGLTGFLLFFVLPCGIIVYYAMIDNAANHHFVGLQQFVKVCRNKAFVLAFTNTVKFTLAAVPLSVLLSLGLAAMLDSRMPFIQNVRACFLCPMMVPAASVILVWRVFFDQKGVVNQVMTFIGGEVTVQTGLCTCCKVRENTFGPRRIRHFAEGKLKMRRIRLQCSRRLNCNEGRLWTGFGQIMDSVCSYFSFYGRILAII